MDNENTNTDKSAMICCITCVIVLIILFFLFCTVCWCPGWLAERIEIGRIFNFLK